MDLSTQDLYPSRRGFGRFMHTIFTIGYESTDIERFLAALRKAGVQIVADVRAVTVSRKKGFSKSKLAAHLEEAGIRYIHYGALGDPKPGREAARAGRYSEFQKIYGKHLASPQAQDALVALSHVAAHHPTCLMCFEREPDVCHRSIVARELAQSGAPVLDLYADALGLRTDAPIGSRKRTHQGVASS